MPTSKAEATWEGGLKSGSGRFVAGSGTFDGTYTFPTRFEGAEGTNPEELIAAAHASCFSMALSGALEAAGTPPKRITTKAACTIEKQEGGFRIVRMELKCKGVVEGIDAAGFAKTAEAAKKGCPVSQALEGNVEITVEAELQ